MHLQSSKVSDTGNKKYKIFCPVAKIEHTKLVGDRRLDLPIDHEGMARNLVIHLYAEGLNTKDGKTGPRLLSFTSIPVHELIEDAKSTAVGEDEVDVEARILSHKAKRHAVKLTFHQVENLQSAKYQQDQLDKKRESEGETLRISYIVRKPWLCHRQGLGGVDEDEDYDSLEEDMKALVKKPEAAHVVEKYAKSPKDALKGTVFRKERKTLSQRMARSTLKQFGAMAGMEEQRLRGEVVIRVGRVEVPVVTRSGDDVYEEKLAKKFKSVKKKWVKDNSVNFQEACDAQNGLTMRSTLDAEFLLDTYEDKGLTSSIVVDCNAACTQHVVLKAQNASMAGGSDVMIGGGYSKSYTLEALQTVMLQLGSFSKQTPVRVFAGGGVNPPGKSHPSRHFSRSRAFPLCQELLLSTEEAAAAAAKTLLPPLPLCGSLALSDPRRDHLHKMRKKCDPRGDLEAAMNLDDPLGGLAKKSPPGAAITTTRRCGTQTRRRCAWPSSRPLPCMSRLCLRRTHWRACWWSRDTCGPTMSLLPSVRASMGGEVSREAG